jgi:arylsulfatase A-like enzyme
MSFSPVISKPSLQVNDAMTQRSAQPYQVVIAGVWFGLLTGLIEVALLGIKTFYLGALVRVGGDVVWMAPLVDLSLFVAVAIVLVLIGRAFPAVRRPRVTFTVFAALSAFAVVLHYSQFVLVTKALIASGIGVQAARLVAPRAARFAALTRQTLPWAAALVVVLGAGLYGWRWFADRQALAALPPSLDRPPNVLLVVLDTVRARSLSLYGYGRNTTPNLERLAKTSATFEWAIAPSPWTFPSHASMFTGRWPYELSADWSTPLTDKFATLAEVLRDRGYLTAGFVANMFYCTTEFGLARGFLHYEDYAVSVSQAVMSTSIGRMLIAFSLNQDAAFRVRQWIGYDEIPGRRSAAEINERFLRWLTGQQGTRPFFAFLNYLDAHQPFLPPSPFDRKFLGDTPRGDPRHWWGREWSPQEIQTETDSYDGSLAYIDDQLGALVAELQRRGLLDNTLLIVTSDHGEHLGEHGFMRHANTLYLELLHVPLVIRFPPRLPSATIRRPVSLRDIPATVLELAGISCPGCFPGVSLTRALRSDTATELSPRFSEVTKGLRLPERYPNSKGDLRSLIEAELHYILNGDGSEELYDLAADPLEQANLARSGGAASTLEHFRSRLGAVTQQVSSPAPASRPAQ